MNETFKLWDNLRSKIPYFGANGISIKENSISLDIDETLLPLTTPDFSLRYKDSKLTTQIPYATKDIAGVIKLGKGFNTILNQLEVLTSGEGITIDQDTEEIKLLLQQNGGIVIDNTTGELYIDKEAIKDQKIVSEIINIDNYVGDNIVIGEQEYYGVYKSAEIFLPANSSITPKLSEVIICTQENGNFVYLSDGEFTSLEDITVFLVTVLNVSPPTDGISVAFTFPDSEKYLEKKIHDLEVKIEHLS